MLAPVTQFSTGTWWPSPLVPLAKRACLCNTAQMRIFTALVLPQDAREALEDLQTHLQRGRLVPGENLHLTLNFLGECSAAEVEAAHEALETLRAKPVLLRLSEPAVFGGRRGQAVGLNANGGDRLSDLHARSEARLRGAGLQFERRRFRPHVTLARLSGRVDAAPLFPALVARHLGPFTCTSFALYASHLHPDGAVYEMLAAYPLG